MKRLFLSVLFLAISTVSAFANDVTNIANYKNWKVYKTQDGTLYAVSYAISKSGNYSKRDEPYLMISNFDNAAELMVYYGYSHKKDKLSEVVVNMNKDGSEVKKFMFQPIGNKSWLRTSKEDSELADAMKKGAKITVYGESHKSTNSIDVYALDGFADAYNTILAYAVKS